MHQLKIIDGRLHLDEKKLCCVQEYSINVLEANNHHGNMCELKLKMVVDLKRVDGKESISEKCERIGEKLREGKMSINDAREEFGLKPIEGGDIITMLMSGELGLKGKKQNTYQTISEFLKRENSEAEKALKSEKEQVCIKADSYIAKEIKYQTALLHELLDEVRNIKK